MGRLKGFLLAVLLTCSLVALPAVVGAAESAGRVPVAKVNGKVLYMDQLSPLLKAQQKNTQHRGTAGAEGDAIAQRRAIEQLVDVELISQQARSQKVPGLEEKVEARIAGRRHAQPEALTDKSEAELRALLLDEFRVEAYLQGQGVANPEIPEAEVRASYDKGRENFRREEAVHLRHITIQLPADAAAGRKAVARDILQRTRQRILAGDSFEIAAQEALRDPDAFQGDLGLLTRRDMPEAIAKAAFALDPGKVSEVVDTPSGIHLVEVLERKPAGIPPYEEMRDFLRKYLQEGRSRQIYQNLVRSLRQQADIVILPGPG